MARIAITGGTGFVGLHTTKTLLRAGHELRLITRGRRRGLRPQGVRMVRADVTRGTGLEEAFTGCDVVVNLVAIIREKGRQTFQSVNAQGAENVALAARAAGVGHVIHVSAIGADPNPRYPYLQTKWQGEQAIRAGGSFTILRPSLLFGPGDEFFTVLVRLIRLNPLVPVVGDGRALFQPLSVSDLAHCIEICVERGPSDQVIEVGGPDHMTYEAIINTIKSAMGMETFVGFPRRNIHVPVAAMVPLAAVMEKILPKPPVTPGQLRLLERHNITRLDAVPKAFGFAPASFAGNCEYLEDY